MIAAPKEIKRINTDQLTGISFRHSAGYFTDGELRERNCKLHFSILLANHAEGNIKIIFNTIDGYRELHAAVWGATDKYILLKGGVFIPVESVAYLALD